MRVKPFDFDPPNVDANGLFEAATPTAGALTLDGALLSGGVFTEGTANCGRKIIIACAGDDDLRTFTVTGTDPDGKAQTEDMAGTDGGSTTSSKYFKTITSISIDDDADGDVTIGTVDEICSITYPLNRATGQAATVQIDVTGTMDFDVQETLEEVQRTVAGVGSGDVAAMSAHQQNAWIPNATIDGDTADVVAQCNVAAKAIRFVVNSYTDTAEAQMFVSQARAT